MKKEKFIIDILKITNDSIPAQWETIIAKTYKDAIDQLKETYKIYVSHDILQNILLKRKKADEHFPYLRVKYHDSYKKPEYKICEHCKKLIN